MTKINERKHANADYDLRADLERIKSAVADATHDVRGKAGEMMSKSYGDLKEKSADMQENIAKYTTEKPFKSLGIALLAGVVIGLLIRK